MGLDGVELVQAVEMTFNIEIPNEVAENIITVGDMYNAVWDRVQIKLRIEPLRCKSALLFYETRRYFFKQFGVLKSDFMPDTLLEDIFPANDRRNQWKKMARELNWKIPGLTLSDAIKKNSVILTLLVAVVEIPLMMIKTPFGSHAFIYVMVGFFLFIFIRNFFKNSFGGMTVRTLIHDMVYLNFRNQLPTELHNRKEVEYLVRQIIMEKQGIEEHKLVPEARFVHDLGVE